MASSKTWAPLAAGALIGGVWPMFIAWRYPISTQGAGGQVERVCQLGQCSGVYLASGLPFLLLPLLLGLVLARRYPSSWRLKLLASISSAGVLGVGTLFAAWLVANCHVFAAACIRDPDARSALLVVGLLAAIPTLCAGYLLVNLGMFLGAKALPMWGRRQGGMGGR